MALLPGSPAIDTGSNPLGLTSDQRGTGFPRIVNNTVGIGAYEVQATSAAVPPPCPVITSQLVLFTQKRNKRGRPVGRPILAGFEFGFNRAMNPATAGNPTNYAITTYVQVRKRVGRRTVKVLQLQPVGFSVSFDSSNNTVKLLLAGSQTFSKGGQITLVATPQGGIDSSGGGFLDGNGDGVGGDNAVFNISANARSLSHA